MKRFLDQFDPEGQDDVIGGALNFLKKHLNELEDKLNFWKVDPQFWSLDIEVMRNTLYYIESQRSIAHNLNKTQESLYPQTLDTKLSSRFDCGSPSVSKSDEISWDRQSDQSKNEGCSCDHDAEMEEQHRVDRSTIKSLRERIIYLNEYQGECIMENAQKDRMLVDMQETILKLQLQMRSKKRECIEQNAQIKGLTSKVRSLELFHAENDSRSSSLNNDLLTTSEERILEEDDENEEEIKSEILQPSEDGNSLDTVERNYLSNSSMRSKTEDIMKGDANYFSVPSRRKLDYYASSPRTQSEIFTPREERFPHQRAKETYSLGSLGVHNVPLSCEGNPSSNSFRNISLSKLENDNLKEETNPENESTLHSLTQNPLQNNTNNMYSLPLSSRKDYISSTSLSRINYYPLPSKKMDDFFTSTLKRTKDE